MVMPLLPRDFRSALKILVNTKGAEDSPSGRTQSWNVRNFWCAWKISMWRNPDMRSNLNKWKPLSKIWMATLKSFYLNFCLKMKLFTCLKSRVNFCLPELPVETESRLTISGTQKISSTRLAWSRSLTAWDTNKLLENYAEALFSLEERCRKITERNLVT